MTTKNAETLAKELDAAVLNVVQAAQELVTTSDGLGERQAQGGYHRLVNKTAFGDLEDAVNAWRAAGEAFVQAQRRSR